MECLTDSVKKEIDDALAKSFESGGPLDYVDFRKSQMDKIDCLSKDEKVDACHLPCTDFRLISEKEKFIKHDNNGHLKKAFTSMFK